MRKLRNASPTAMWCLAALIFATSWAIASWSLVMANRENAALRQTIRVLEEEIVNRKATAELLQRQLDEVAK